MAKKSTPGDGAHACGVKGGGGYYEPLPADQPRIAKIVDAFRKIGTLTSKR